MNNLLHPNEINSKIKNLKSQSKKLVKKYQDLLNQGHYIKSLTIMKDIKHIDQEIEELKFMLQEYDKTTLNTLLPDDQEIKNQVYRELIEISLASDYLMQTIENFRDTLSNLNIESADIFSEVKELSTRANKTASRLLTDKSQTLTDMLLDDDDLLASLHQETLNYIKQNTNL